MNRLILILLGLCLTVALAKEPVKLTKGPQTKRKDDLRVFYTLNLTSPKASMPLKIKLTLSAKQSWIRTNNCTLCTGSGSSQKCSDKCKSKIGSKTSSPGLSCDFTKKTCLKRQGSNSSFSDDKFQGTVVNVQLTSKDLKFVRDVVAVSKVKNISNPESIFYDGAIHLLNNQQNNNQGTENSETLSEFSIISMNDSTKALLEGLQLTQYMIEGSEEIQQQFSGDSEGKGFAIKSISIVGPKVTGNMQIDAGNIIAVPSLQYRGIVFPESKFKDLQDNIVIRLEQQGTHKCSFSSKEINVVGCNKTKGGSIDNNYILAVLKDKLIVLTTSESHNVSISMEVLLPDKCNKTGCSLNIGQGSSSERIELGEVFFNAYAVGYDLKEQKMKLALLKTSSGQKIFDAHKILASSSETNSQQKIEEESTTDKQQKTSMTTKPVRGGRASKSLQKKAPQISKPEDTQTSMGFFGVIWWIIKSLFKFIFLCAFIVLVFTLWQNFAGFKGWLKDMFLKPTSRKFHIAGQRGYEVAADQDNIEPLPPFVQGYDPKHGEKQFWEQDSVQGI